MVQCGGSTIPVVIAVPSSEIHALTFSCRESSHGQNAPTPISTACLACCLEDVAAAGYPFRSSFVPTAESGQ